MKALISVFDKSEIVEFASCLESSGWELISTGGTRKVLTGAGLNPVDIKTVTGFSEMLDGRVKSLHPAVHGALLARRDHPEDLAAVQAQNMPLIDMVVVNLYPFPEKRKAGLDDESLLDFIDIGGPAMLRSAAKNHKDVLVLCDPADYGRVWEALENGGVPWSLRRELAGKAFALSGAYDASVADFLLGEDDFPPYLTASYRKIRRLRYGENPHQGAAFYERADQPGAVSDFEQFGGRSLSFNNLRDMDAAWKTVCDFEDAVCCNLKHGTPCAVAVADDAESAWKRAYEADPVSIFGGIAAFNREVGKVCAERLIKVFLEIVIAPAFTAPALEIFQSKKNLRVIKMRRTPVEAREFLTLDGGLLLQDSDRIGAENWKTVTKTLPSKADTADLNFAWKVVKHVKSNAVVAASGGVTTGIGGGMVNRINAAEQALKQDRKAAVLASDAFFPFDDIVSLCKKRGVRAVIQPGGSIRDAEIIQACDRADIAMIFTGTRHFKH